MRPALIGEEVRTRRAFRRNRGAFAALPIRGVLIIAPIVLAQHKRNKRIGGARTPIRHASPIVIELPY